MATPLTETEYASLLAAAPPSSDAWHDACRRIKAARGGIYPSDWFERVISQPDKFRFTFNVRDVEQPTPPKFATRLEEIEWAMSRVEIAEALGRPVFLSLTTAVVDEDRMDDDPSHIDVL